MKKIIASVAVALPLLFLGCAQQNSNVKASSTVQNGANTPVKIAKTNEAPAKVCQNLNVYQCINLGDKYYNQGDFINAISFYDYSCNTWWRDDLGGCLKMAKMFEKGEGVSINIPNALDIYERACYSGHTPSCKDIKRLQK